MGQADTYGSRPSLTPPFVFLSWTSSAHVPNSYLSSPGRRLKVQCLYFNNSSSLYTVANSSTSGNVSRAFGWDATNAVVNVA